MAKKNITTKRVAISKANAQMVAIVAAACFISVFCLFAAKAVWSQDTYRAKVIKAKETAHKQLSTNVKTYSQLKQSYEKFDNTTTNAIGGNKDGGGDNDGSNSKIILDALPSTYDFPALASSIEKIMSDRGLKVTGITGTDDQVSQQTNASSNEPKTVVIPFSFTVDSADYGSVQKLVTALEHSIRPIVIDNLSLSGSNSKMTITVSAHTYYQPAKNLNIKKQVVK